MSSMRNAIQRRNHKEREQPAERQKWGLLEKRKDYKLRAADYRLKNAKLKILSQKARDRNPDEFSYKMLSSKVDKEGRKVAERGNKALSTEVVKLLKTQDAAYIRTMLQIVRKEREHLGQKLVLDKGRARAAQQGDSSTKSEHRIFVENEQQQQEFDSHSRHGQDQTSPAESAPALPQRPLVDLAEDEDEAECQQEQSKRHTKKHGEEEKLLKEKTRRWERSRERAKSSTAARLASAKKREQELRTAEAELELQRAKMSNVVGGVNKHGTKFKIRERKR